MCKPALQHTQFSFVTIDALVSITLHLLAVLPYPWFSEHFSLFQLSFVSKEAPGKIQTAVEDAERGTEQVSGFCHDQEVLDSDICHHLADSTNLNKQLISLTDQIEDLQRYSVYLQWIAKIDHLR